MSPNGFYGSRDYTSDTCPQQTEFDFAKDYKPVPFVTGLSASPLYGQYNQFPSVWQHDNQYNQQPCAIAEYFKAHPKETSVMMVCFCPRCTVMC
jgi:hypothetical protein